MAAGYGKGWITGECVRSRPYTHISDEDWNTIFKKPQPLKDNDPTLKHTTATDSRNSEQPHLPERGRIQQGHGVTSDRSLVYTQDGGQDDIPIVGEHPK